MVAGEGRKDRTLMRNTQGQIPEVCGSIPNVAAEDHLTFLVGSFRSGGF